MLKKLFCKHEETYWQVSLPNKTVTSGDAFIAEGRQAKKYCVKCNKRLK